MSDNLIDLQIQELLGKMAQRHENPGLGLAYTVLGAEMYIKRQKQKLARGEPLGYGKETHMGQAEQLQQKLAEGDAILEAGYPGELAELAKLTGHEVAQVQRAVEYTATQLRENKHNTLGSIMMFHRTLAREQ